MSAATFSLYPLSNTIKIPKKIITFKPKANFTPPSAPPTTSTSCPSTTSPDDNSKITKSHNLEYTNRDTKPLSNSNSALKAPTAPWMKGPLLVEQNQILELSKSRTKKGSSFGKIESPDKALTSKEGGGRGKKEMKMIFQGIEKLQEPQNSEEAQRNLERVKFKFPPGELFGEGSCKLDEEKAFEEEDKVVETQNSFEMIGLDGSVKSVMKMPWEKDEEMVVRRVKKERVKTAAELKLDGDLLERLRGEAAKMRKWATVKKAGVTQAVLDQVHSIWKDNELAMLKFDIPLCRNMDRAREIVETKTGGFVVWCHKDALVVYRGFNYQFSQRTFLNIHNGFLDGQGNCQDTLTADEVNSTESYQDKMLSGRDDNEESISISESLYEREADRLLDALGPRFVDWWWRKPLPVDADLLPGLVPGFRPPFRLCPPGVRSKLTDYELTYLRMIARSLPTHFVLGRNRKLQGLAEAILKLWEKCPIAKIALKWGIPNTDNEQMANELKLLTGGVLLLRNKFFIILCRGKDFLPSQVANLIVERELELSRCQLQEEAARLKANDDYPFKDEQQPVTFSEVGTLSEFQSMRSECETSKSGNSEAELELKAEKGRLEKDLRSEQQRLFVLKKKIEKSAKELEKLNFEIQPSERDADQEILTDEERECLRMIGLKMESSLVLGRRGIFNGVIEGLHQHWKHKEVVKVMTMQRRFSQVIYTANLLMAESGGILVSIDKLKEGHAIIIYRGKNFTRAKLVRNNLLNKRDALRRSLLVQRVGSLKFYANQRKQAISILKQELAKVEVKIDQMATALSGSLRGNGCIMTRPILPVPVRQINQ